MPIIRALNQGIYIIGGCVKCLDSEITLSSCEKFSDGNFSGIKNLPIGLSGCTVSSVDHESFMVIGGIDKNNTAENTTYFYCTVNNDWTPGPSMCETRYGHSSVSLVDTSIS